MYVNKTASGCCHFTVVVTPDHSKWGAVVQRLERRTLERENTGSNAVSNERTRDRMPFRTREHGIECRFETGNFFHPKCINEHLATDGGKCTRERIVFAQ